MADSTDGDVLLKILIQRRKDWCCIKRDEKQTRENLKGILSFYYEQGMLSREKLEPILKEQNLTFDDIHDPLQIELLKHQTPEEILEYHLSRPIKLRRIEEV